MRTQRSRHHGSGDAERHLSGQQLVDFLIGASSRTGKLFAGRHLAACSFCREDLENLRGIDRQLEGGAHRLATIPRRSSTAGETRRAPSAPSEMPPAAARAMTPEWHRVSVPWMAAAACGFFALHVVVERAGPPAPARSRSVERVELPAAPSRPIVCAHEMEARSFPENPEAKSAAVEIRPLAAASKSAPAAWTTRVGPAAPRRARAPRERQRVDSAASHVLRQQHPGAGKHDDGISPPSRGV